MVRLRKKAARALCILACGIGVPAVLQGQAWVPEKGTGVVSFTYQDSYVKNHLGDNGERLAWGKIYSHGFIHQIDYGLTDKLAITLSLPLITSKYSGDDPESPLDNNQYHTSFQDFRFRARYLLATHPLVITPFIGTIVPSHGYDFFAHSAVGQNEHALEFGLSTGRRLDPILPRAYFQTTYSFALGLQHVSGYRINRHQITSQFGYFVTRRMAVVAVEDLFLSTGGIYGDALTAQQLPIHDEILNMKHLDLGPGVGYSFTPNFDVYGAVATTVWGIDTHALHSAVIIGMNWSFRTRFASPAISAFPQTAPRKSSVTNPGRTSAQ